MPKFAGALVFADVASIRHAERAAAAGADGLVLLTAGAGGQTGWLNPFVFVRAVRAFFDGPIVLAGGISDVDTGAVKGIAIPGALAQIGDVDVDRYLVDNEIRQVLVAARGLNSADLPSQSFVNRHIVYTHGYGVVASPSNATSSVGFVVRSSKSCRRPNQSSLRS